VTDFNTVLSILTIKDQDGIRMDPNKVDCVINWKMPTVTFFAVS
jgi:hypothetical protein